ncbi:hypothetical protein [Pandoraea sp. NPDC087047]|uniref:HoxN/HupN/NixA family nickel/cobalt transporter n=1 Tax=Pandoraea sp. NPDC087047 TaxID=3364390 RepID=UPI00382EBED1
MYVTQFFDARHLGLYGARSLFADVMTTLGVPNAWQGATDSWGIGVGGLDALCTVPDAGLLYFEPLPAAAQRMMQDNRLWRALPAPSAGRVASLAPFWGFGMLTIDTTDGIIMISAYGWAFVKPLRKLYYNLTITLLSTVVALLIGGIEVIGLIEQTMQFSGAFWRYIDLLNNNFGLLGYAIVGIFAIAWICSALLYRWKGYDREIGTADQYGSA